MKTTRNGGSKRPQILKSYTNSIFNGKKIGVGYFLKIEKCIHNYINMYNTILYFTIDGFTKVCLPLVN